MSALRALFNHSSARASNLLADGSDSFATNVRFGSKADICSAKGHVRFAPNSDRESGLVPIVMSALPPKAHMCGAIAYVRFGPKADMATKGEVRPRLVQALFAVRCGRGHRRKRRR